MSTATTTTPERGMNADASNTAIVSISQTKDTGTIGKDGSDELIYATVGDATLDGGTGTDEVSFASTSKEGAPVFFFGALADLGLGIGGALVSGEYYRYVLTDFENVEGTTYHDTIRGDEDDNVLSGLSGNDRLEGKDGNDTIFAGDGDDKVDGGWGNDSLFAGKGDDTLIGGEGVDTAVFSTAIGSSITFSSGVTVDLGTGEATARISSQTHTYDLTEIENITGSNANDMLTGDDGDNVITGNQGDDTIMGGAGDDFIIGGVGNDIALYAGASHHFTVQYNLAEGETYIIDRSGAEGTDTRGTNILRFSDTDFVLARDSGVQFQDVDFATLPFTELVELYIAYFNRAPDAAGLQFWLFEVINGITLDKAAEFFFDQPETRALYGADVDPSQFVAQVYENVLGRQPDAAGSQFWVDALTNGAVTEGQFIRAFLQGARAETPIDADAEFTTQQDADRAFLDAKTNIGIDFAATKGMSDLSDAAAVMALFDGSAASVTDAAAAAQDAYEEALGSDGAFLIQLIGIEQTMSEGPLF